MNAWWLEYWYGGQWIPCSERTTESEAKQKQKDATAYEQTTQPEERRTWYRVNHD